MAPQETRKKIESWLFKLHLYTGLYLLLFIWLFSISGLLLNHPRWSFAQFWPQREESSFERSVDAPPETEDLAKAKNLMEQLDISGEIGLTATDPAQGSFEFMVTRPGKIIKIKTDLNSRRATVEKVQTNGWGQLHMLHTFTGVRMNDPRNDRDWFLTRVWSLSIDAVSLGCVLLVLSGVYLSLRVRRNLRWKLIILGLGTFCCGFFLFGMGWLNL